ncbi:MAG: hypothetical protein KBA72_10075 [Thermoanaerobaculia bacterium]|nr:hypothetical protein [Thermoanaerobaculia bacterium]
MRRTAYEVLAGCAASFTLAALLPALPLGGVRGMVVVLPVVAALFASVGRAAAAGRPSTLELALWGGWIVLALQHFALGLAGSSALVASAGLALAGARTLRLAVRLYRAVATASLWPFFALPLALYLFAWPWTTTARAPDGDEPYYLLLAHSLAEDGDVDLADDYRAEAWRSFTSVPVAPQPGDPIGPDGEIYSRHSALLPLALAPLYRLAGPFGAQLGMLALAAAAAAAGLGAARARFPDRRRGLLAAWMILAFAPPLLLYAGQFWVEVPAALLVALVLRSLARLDPAGKTATGGGASRAELLALALPLVALPLLKLRFLALALPLGMLALVRLRGARRRRRELLLLAAVTLVALGCWNLWRFGNPLRMYGGDDLAIFAIPFADQLRGDLGLFFDLAFGLFALAPIWLLLLPALATRLGARAPGAPWRTLVSAPLPEFAALLPYVLLIGMRREWYGGWSPPFRYGVVLLPAFALLLPALFGERRPPAGVRWLCAVLGALTAALALVYLVHPAWAYSLANGSSRLVDELASELAVDLVRLLPSMVRPRPATWIVPALVTLAVLAIARFRGTGGMGGMGGGRLRPRARRGSRLVWPLAALCLLLAWCSLLLTAARLPTARIEFEDAWVEHRGGALFPERWTVDRTRFDGGWALSRNSEVAARPIPAGATCRLAIRLLSAATQLAPLALEVRAGDRLVVTLPLAPAEIAGDAPLPWTTLTTEPFPLASGEALRFRATGPPGAGRSFVVLDRAEVTWK